MDLFLHFVFSIPRIQVLYLGRSKILKEGIQEKLGVV